MTGWGFNEHNVNSVPVFLSSDRRTPHGRISLDEELTKALVNGNKFTVSLELLLRKDEEPRVIGFALVPDLALPERTNN